MSNYMINNIEAIRKDHKQCKQTGDRIAVIVNTNSTLGVQYWTEAMISAGIQTNTDRSFSYFIEKI